MMSKTVLALLLVCAVTLQGTHAWWDNGKAAQFALDLGEKALETTADVVIAVGTAYVERKRDAEDGVTLPEDVRQKLEKSCPVLLGTDPDGVNQNILLEAISESDADGNGALSGTEMLEFTKIMEAIDLCEEFVALTNGGQP